MRLTVRLRQRAKTVTVYLTAAPGTELTTESAERCAEIMRKRIAYLRQRYSIERFEVRVAAPDRLEVETFSHVDLSRVQDLLVKRYAIELRVVEQYDFDAAAHQDLPPDAEVLDEVQQLYSIREIGKVEVKRTPRLVARTPALVIERLASAKFMTRGLRRDPIVLIEMRPEDAVRFAEITRRYVGRRLAVVIDREIKTAPLVQSPIAGGRAEIHGVLFKQEARDMAAFLDMGALPCAASLNAAVAAGNHAGSTNRDAATSTGALQAHASSARPKLPEARLATSDD